MLCVTVSVLCTACDVLPLDLRDGIGRISSKPRHFCYAKMRLHQTRNEKKEQKGIRFRNIVIRFSDESTKCSNREEVTVYLDQRLVQNN